MALLVTAEIAVLEKASSELSRDGFTRIQGIFTAHELASVATVLDGLLLGQTAARHIRYADIAPARCNGLIATSPLSPEFTRPMLFDHRLRLTSVYRKCLTIAKHLCGPFAAYSFDHAIYKYPDTSNSTPWHQDHAFSPFASALNTVHFWIPLQRVTKLNGCLRFVPGSHLSGAVPHEDLVTASGGTTKQAALADVAQGVSVELEAGDISLHLPMTIHSSWANNSDILRKAWIIHFGPFGMLSNIYARACAFARI